MMILLPVIEMLLINNIVSIPLGYIAVKSILIPTSDKTEAPTHTAIKMEDNLDISCTFSYSEFIINCPHFAL